MGLEIFREEKNENTNNGDFFVNFDIILSDLSRDDDPLSNHLIMTPKS